MFMINAYRCDLSDQGLAHFAKLEDLEYLNLHGCSNVTGAGLQHLARCKALSVLNLDSAMLQRGKYTLADLQELRRALPRITFTQDDAQPIAESPADPDRRAAQWLQSLGHVRVDVLEPDAIMPRIIEAGQPLPNGPFRLVGVAFGGEAVDKLGNRLVDELAIHLRGVRLTHVYLPRSLDANGIARLIALPEFAHLSYVNCGSSVADDRLFSHLAKLPNLSNLDGGILQNVTGKGISALKVCPLTDLTLIHTPLVPEAIEEMQQLASLRYLNISAVPCTERHVAALARLKISSLIAGSAGIDDAMAMVLAKMDTMEVLSLPGNSLTDKGLAEFKKLRRLKSLDLSGTQVTAAGVDELQKALPECKIRRE
jgi:hypothetical protein